jgi:hypothetical protein
MMVSAPVKHVESGSMPANHNSRPASLSIFVALVDMATLVPLLLLKLAARIVPSAITKQVHLRHFVPHAHLVCTHHQCHQLRALLALVVVHAMLASTETLLLHHMTRQRARTAPLGGTSLMVARRRVSIALRVNLHLQKDNKIARRALVVLRVGTV